MWGAKQNRQEQQLSSILNRNDGYEQHKTVEITLDLETYAYVDWCLDKLNGTCGTRGCDYLH